MLPDETLGAKEQRAVLESKVREAARDAGPLAELEDHVWESWSKAGVAAAKSGRDRARARRAAVRDWGGAGGVGPRIAEMATKHLQPVVPSYAVTLIHGEGLTFLPAWSDGRPFGRRALSDGTADQFYFAVRVALAEVQLGGLRPPMILDDPFQYCDRARRPDSTGYSGS